MVVGPPPTERPQDPPTSRSAPWRWALPLLLATCALATTFAVAPVVANDGDVAAVLRVGRYSASRPVVEQDLPDPPLTEDYGHDGQQFYVLARALPDLGDAQGDVDKLRYRARRILLPVLAAPFPDGPPRVWAMIGWNVLAIGAAGVALGSLARRCGVTPWVGLAVALSPGMIDSAQGALADAPAVALALWGVVLCRSRPWAAGALLALGGLARETTLTAAAGVGLGARAWRSAAVAVGTVAAWAVVVTAWLPADDKANTNNVVVDLLDQVGIPLAGWADVGWTSAGAVLGAVLLACSVAAAWVLRRRLPELAWWLALDAVLLVLADQGVAGRAANLARVAPLALPAAVLALAVVRGDAGATEVDGGGDGTDPPEQVQESPRHA